MNPISFVDAEKKALNDEIARLIAENKKKDAVIGGLESRIIEENKKKDAVIGGLESKICGLESKICGMMSMMDTFVVERDEMRRRLAYYENSNTPPSHRSLQYREQKKKDKQERKDSGQDGTKRHPGRKAGHVGVSHSRKSDYTVHEKKDSCAQCSSTKMTHVKKSTKQVLDVKKPETEVYTRVMYESTCKDCGAVHFPPDISHTGIGVTLLAEIVSLWEKRVTIDKITEFVNEKYRLSLCAATIQHALDASSEKLEPISDGIRKDVLQEGEHKYVDETPIPVDGNRQYIWCVTTKDTASFAVTPSRSAAAFNDSFPDIAGPFVTDGYAVYSKLHNRQWCWAHILREAEFLARNKKMRQPYARLQELFSHAKSLQGAPDVANVLGTLESQVREIAAQYSAAECGLGTTLENAAPHLFTFLLHPGMEPTNNRAERALRGPVVHRKVRGQLRCARGTRMFGVLLSCTYTWRLRGKSIMGELLAALAT